MFVIDPKESIPGVSFRFRPTVLSESAIFGDFLWFFKGGARLQFSTAEGGMDPPPTGGLGKYFLKIEKCFENLPADPKSNIETLTCENQVDHPLL